MRRLGLIAGVLGIALAASSASAQFWGSMPQNIPPSVTSVTPRNQAPGIPPSITSTRSFTSWQAMPPVTFHGRDHNFNRHRFNNAIIFYPYYPFYPYADYSSYPADQQYAQPAAENTPEAPAQTVFENRPGYKAPSAASDAAAAGNTEASKPAAPSEPEPAQPTTLLVFKDGHQLEIENYVIVGDTLYNMSGNYRSYKIPLAQLDLPATVKANEDRGVDFHLPKQNGA
jgi:hypothetical protein